MIGLDPDDDDDGFIFGVEVVVVEDDEVVFVSLLAAGLGGEVAFARGDPEVKLDAGLREELPELERSLGGGDVLFGSLPPVSTVTLISAELEVLLDLERSSTASSFLLSIASPPLPRAAEEDDPLLLPLFPVVEVPPLPAGRTGPVSAPIWLHVLASIASGLDLESSCKREINIRSDVHLPSPRRTSSMRSTTRYSSSF